MELQDKKILTFEEGCKYLGYKKSYCYKMTHQNILPFSKPTGKRIFFEREKLDAWMLSNASKSLAERQIDAATYETTKGGAK